MLRFVANLSYLAINVCYIGFIIVQYSDQIVTMFIVSILKSLLI
jgi:hypothetical protein